MSKQKEIEDHNNKSGNSKKSWKFYEELAQCLAKDATVKPVYTMESSLHLEQSCPILPHCYGPLTAVNGPYVLHKPSLLLTVRMLSTYGACISLLHEGTMRYGSFDPYGPKTYGACILLLHQGTMRYGSFDPYSP